MKLSKASEHPAIDAASESTVSRSCSARVSSKCSSADKLAVLPINSLRFTYQKYSGLRYFASIAIFRDEIPRRNFVLDQKRLYYSNVLIRHNNFGIVCGD